VTTAIDIPTALTPAETEKLQSLARDKYVLEVGALLGYSTVALAQVARRVVSIDPHEGYPEDNPRPTFSTYWENLVRHGVKDKVQPYKATWQEVVAHEGGFPAPYDMVFMDLTGRYEDTMELLMYLHGEWGWRLKTIAVHDCGHPDWPGVDRAVEEFRKFIGMHATFQQVDRLGVFTYA
jgi:predicted O-methyltransferase YrrM